MLDMHLLRTDPELVKENIRKKFQDEKLPLVDEVVEFDRQFREAKSQGDALRSKRNRQRAAGLETGAQRGGNATVDAGMQEVSDSYQDAVQRVQRLITQLENQEKLLDSMYATYEKNPTEDLYNRYANIYDLYTRTYESYEKAMQAAEDVPLP